MKVHVFRLTYGMDLKNELKQFAKVKNITAGIILTAVGALTKASIRMAGATSDYQEINTYNEDFEVVSLVGTLSPYDSHIHVCLSDKKGKTIGGHIKEGCIIGVTMEIAIGELENMIFMRKPDSRTGFNELTVSNKENKI